jgi:hypothetical protein
MSRTTEYPLSLIEYLGIRGAKTNGTALGAMGPKNGRLTACADSITSSEMTAFVTPLIRLDVKLIVIQVFWILYKDLLKHFQHIDRTRLFGPDWSITQQWTSVNVPWSVNYLDTHFRLNLSKASPVVIMLTQVVSVTRSMKPG